jgi:hypothetical protein
MLSTNWMLGTPLLRSAPAALCSGRHHTCKVEKLRGKSISLARGGGA